MGYIQYSPTGTYGEVIEVIREPNKVPINDITQYTKIDKIIVIIPPQRVRQNLQKLEKSVYRLHSHQAYNKGVLPLR